MGNIKKIIKLKCGNTMHDLTIPESVSLQIAEPKKMKNTQNDSSMIRDALNKPIASLPIEKIVKKGQRICIITDDNTRHTPVKKILKELLPRLEKSGINKNQILIVMALGSHRKMTSEEIIEKVGKNVFDTYRVINSEFHDKSLMVEIGQSQIGTPIRVLKEIMEADIRIGIGSIAPHGCMGWSGGAKILYPGITSEDIVSEFHAMQGLTDDLLYGNEDCHIRLEVEKWTEKIGLHFIINTVFTDSLELYRVVSGHYVKAHRAGVAFAKDVCGAYVEKRPDIVVISSYPLAADFWQCTKALYCGAKVINEGGTLLLLSPCEEGLGPHKEICEYIQLEDGKNKLLQKIKSKETGEELLAMSVGISIGQIKKRCKIEIITDGIPKEEILRGGFKWHSENDLQKAFNESLVKYKNPNVLIIPSGGNTVPYLL